MQLKVSSTSIEVAYYKGKIWLWKTHYLDMILKSGVTSDTASILCLTMCCMNTPLDHKWEKNKSQAPTYAMAKSFLLPPA